MPERDRKLFDMAFPVPVDFLAESLERNPPVPYAIVHADGEWHKVGEDTLECAECMRVLEGDDADAV